jgi:hypothetical protein
MLAPLAHGQEGEKQAIRTVIESVSRAIDNADLRMLLAQFAEDAIIDSKIARAKVSKQKYAEITMVDSTRATVLATIYPMKLARRFVYDHEWTLEKRDGRWLIVETTYRTRLQEPVEGLRVV